MPISRKKACERCRLAKARCSLDPVCLRCLNRGLECRYNGASLRVGPYTRPHLLGLEQISSVASPGITTEDLSGLFSFPGSRATTLVFGEAAVEEFAPNNTEVNYWDSYYVNEPRGTSWDQAVWNGSQGGPHPPLSRDSPHQEAPHDVASDLFPTFTSPRDLMGESQLTNPQPRIAAVVATDESVETAATAKGLPRPGSPPSPREENERAVEIEHESAVAIYVKRYEHLLAQRPSVPTERQLMARILLGQVENFPMMLIRGSRLPPFIYPKCVLNNRLSRRCTAANGTHQCLLEPLANCATLTQMFYSRSSGNSQFVWKAIYDEKRRLYEESHTYDTPTLLAAVQALGIYLLIQAQDTESIAKNDAASLAVTFCDLLSILHSQNSKYKTDIYQNPNLSQESWAIYESIRRIVNLCYMIRMVLVIQIGDPRRCCALLASPLPSARGLWDQDATETWAIRLHRYTSRMVSDGVLTLDDLLCYSGGGHSGNNDEPDAPIQKDLVTWCESLDEFGTLVWMASLLDRQAP
ncbi:hypothetical protein F4823DRAFT_143093 [Ustulina deusta]|nr:hypothetical protein F4823DRAFT_143093 [Ustulina deusta]